MFHVPRVNVIESDEGFSVEILGRTGLLYTESGRSLHIDSEVLASTSKAGIILAGYSKKSWDPPYNNEIFDKNKRETIIENIRKALRFQGFEIEVA